MSSTLRAPSTDRHNPLLVSNCVRHHFRPHDKLTIFRAFLLCDTKCKHTHLFSELTVPNGVTDSHSAGFHGQTMGVARNSECSVRSKERCVNERPRAQLPEWSRLVTEAKWQKRTAEGARKHPTGPILVGAGQHYGPQFPRNQSNISAKANHPPLSQAGRCAAPNSTLEFTHHAEDSGTVRNLFRNNIPSLGLKCNVLSYKHPFLASAVLGTI